MPLPLAVKAVRMRILVTKDEQRAGACNISREKILEAREHDIKIWHQGSMQPSDAQAATKNGQLAA